MTFQTLTVISIAALISSAQASVQLTFQAGNLYNFDGTQTIANGSKIGILADTDGNESFLTSTSTFSGRTFGATDIGSTYEGDTLLGVFDSQDLVGAIGLNGAFTGTVAEGTHLAIVWLNGYTNSADTIVAGQEYGVYQSLTFDVNNGGDSALIVGADGFDYTIAYFDQSVTSDPLHPSVADFSASNIVTVPEPSSVALLGLGSLALLLRRRR